MKEYFYQNTALKVFKYGVISDPYFPPFALNTKIYEVNFRVQSKYRKIRTRNKSVFGHFSHSETFIPVSAIFNQNILLKISIRGLLCFGLS